MLRLLIAFLSLSYGVISFAETGLPEYQEPGVTAIEKERSSANSALVEAQELIDNGTVNQILTEERAKLRNITEINVGGNFQLPEFLEKEREDRFLSKVIAAGKSIETQKNERPLIKYPVVLVSLSMPQNELRSLIRESNSIGAAIAVRGLYNSDFQETVVRLKEAAGGEDGGIMIDPTLFTRFEVNTVPTFVLPLESIEPCTESGCQTPRHIKASGSVSLKYFLELVENLGSKEEKNEASLWLVKYGS